MQHDIKKLFSFIKLKGYTQSKDVLGFYFDKGDRKLSIMRNASWFICYHNVKVNDSWQLVNKSQIFDNFGSALLWVAREIEKQK